MTYQHVLYPSIADKSGTIYKCAMCDRKIVIFSDGTSAVIKDGDTVTHEIVLLVEEVELPPEFEALFTEKGWA